MYSFEEICEKLKMYLIPLVKYINDYLELNGNFKYESVDTIVSKFYNEIKDMEYVIYPRNLNKDCTLKIKCNNLIWDLGYDKDNNCFTLISINDSNYYMYSFDIHNQLKKYMMIEKREKGYLILIATNKYKDYKIDYRDDLYIIVTDLELDFRKDENINDLINRLVKEKVNDMDSFLMYGFRISNPYSLASKRDTFFIANIHSTSLKKILRYKYNFSNVNLYDIVRSKKENYIRSYQNEDKWPTVKTYKAANQKINEIINYKYLDESNLVLSIEEEKFEEAMKNTLGAPLSLMPFNYFTYIRDTYLSITNSSVEKLDDEEFIADYKKRDKDIKIKELIRRKNND